VKYVARGSEREDDDEDEQERKHLIFVCPLRSGALLNAGANEVQGVLFSPA
jgi:hypothetical protein